MNNPQEVFDLSIVFTQPPLGSPPEILAQVTVQCDGLGLSHTGEVFTDPLTQYEREDLLWYLEEYWQWPYLEFAERGKRVEALLGKVGRRFYQALFGGSEAQNILQTWQQYANVQHQISIVSEIASILRLPWELLADSQGFLALHDHHPISIVRRLPKDEQQATLITPFELPLRILLVTARPEGEGFVDPRSISHELVDELQRQAKAGTIELEFLRPPTFTALSTRLKNSERPIHVLHFDGHGGVGGKEQQGILLFETETGTSSRVEAKHLAKVLKNSGVRLAVLTACQSAMDTKDDALSSVSTQLITSGMDAVIAMSSSILVTSAALYVEAFYHVLAEGLPVSIAQEQARQALQRDPYRHLFSRRQDEEAAPVTLADWWVPHFYQQRSLTLHATTAPRKHAPLLTSTSVRFNGTMPKEPRYRFGGRARELLQIERHLLQKRLVVLSGFGGVGKTALAREAADWLTRTGMYTCACFVSFEHGGDAAMLLSTLGTFLGINDGRYNPKSPDAALAQLQPAFSARPTLLIADNLESLLLTGDAPLEHSARTELWCILRELVGLGVGVLLTSRAPLVSEDLLAPGTHVADFPLGGLTSYDAYALATRLLEDLGIDRARTPYAELRGLLDQLDHHPLAIQLVLPALRTTLLTSIRTDFADLLSKFTSQDDQESGRNRSLLASLDYSLRRLTKEQRALLHRLAVFEGGAMENRLIEITEIAEADWAELRKALEQAALLTVELLGAGFSVPYLHFHPVLVPFLRGQSELQDEALELRYAQQYYESSSAYLEGDIYLPTQTRVVVQRELPNLRCALGWLLQRGDLDRAVEMAGCIGWFLTLFGLHQEQQRMHQRITEALASRNLSDALTQAKYLNEMSLGEEEQRQGDFQAARACYQRLLTRIESEPEGNPFGPGSFAHATTLGELGRCLWNSGNSASAEPLCRRAIALIEALLQQYPESLGALVLQSAMLADLGEVLLRQGKYTEAKQAHEHSLQIDERLGNERGQAVSLMQLGTIALQQGAYPEARMRYQKAQKTFHDLREKASEGIVWHQLGMLAEKEQNWSEAEQSLRESLSLKVQLEDHIGAAATCNGLGVVVQSTNRLAEAKGWYQRAIELSQEADPTSREHALSLFRLAFCLVQEVQEQAGQDGSLQLEEARRYAEQALAIDQVLQSPDLWERFGILATIAEMQGRHEAGRAYRRQEKEGYASFADHRYLIDQQFGALFPALAIALDSLTVRALMEERLLQLEANGWHLSEALQRIWTGKRDWQTLVENLNNQEALFVLRVLETLATLPPTIRETLAKEDQQAFQQAFDALSIQEQQVVMQIIQSQQEETQAQQEQIIARLIPTVRELLEMLAKGDQQAFQQAFDALSIQEQQVVMGAIQVLRGEQGDDEEKSS